MGRQWPRDSAADHGRSVALSRLSAVHRAVAAPARRAGADAGTSGVSRASRRRVSRRPKLRQLAERLGIVSAYLDQTGKRVQTRDETREKLLAVMGFEAPTEDAAAGWLYELDFE